MKGQFLKIALLFLMLIGSTEIVYGQQLTQDSCICYTDTQDKRCLECLVNKPKQDSIILAQKNYIIFQENTLLQEQRKTEKAKRTQKLMFYGGGIVGILIGVFTTLAIK